MGTHKVRQERNVKLSKFQFRLFDFFNLPMTMKAVVTLEMTREREFFSDLKRVKADSACHVLVVLLDSSIALVLQHDSRRFTIRHFLHFDLDKKNHEN